MDTPDIEPEGYAWDCQAGPIYSFRRLTDEVAIGLSRLDFDCQIVTVVVWPGHEDRDHRAELRQYFALSIGQALARALEVQTRLLAQHTRCIPIQIRPATTAETEAFFNALHELESRMPCPIPAASVDERTRTRASNSDQPMPDQTHRGSTGK